MEIDVTVVVTICGAITSIAAAAAVITKVVNKTVKKISAETIKNELAKSQKELVDKMSDLNNKLTEFCDSQNVINDQLKASLLASTRDRINQAHDYYIKKKYIGAHSLFVIEELYASYKDLGGNSFISHQMEDIRSLEVKSAETYDE